MRPKRLRFVGHKVNWEDLDRETAARVLAFIESMGWLLGIVSAVRTFAQQLFLWLGWKAGKPGFNLAADPHRSHPDGTVGSKHQPQGPPGHKRGFAVDLARLPGAPRWKKVHARAALYGLAFPVYRPRRENWHVVAYVRFTGDAQPVYREIDPSAAAAVDRWRDWIAANAPDLDEGDALRQFVADCQATVLRAGDTGPAVRYAQQRLNANDSPIVAHPSEDGGGRAGKPLPHRWPVLTLDCVYGADTETAVRTFQHDHGLAPDGIIGPDTWAALTA